jgi:hypothetical protein
MTGRIAGDTALAACLEPYLLPREELRWCGRPDPAVLFAPGDGQLFVIGLSVGGYGVWWTAGAWVETGPAEAVAGLPLLLFGFYMLAGRFLIKRARKRRTVYGVTRGRALCLAGGVYAEIPLTGPPRFVHRGRGGHVSVIFGPAQGPYFRGLKTQTLGARPSPSDFGANSGMFDFRRQHPFAFYDVAQGSELLGALDPSWPEWEAFFAGK